MAYHLTWLGTRATNTYRKIPGNGAIFDKAEISYLEEANPDLEFKTRFIKLELHYSLVVSGCRPRILSVQIALS